MLRATPALCDQCISVEQNVSISKFILIHIYIVIRNSRIHSDIERIKKSHDARHRFLAVATLPEQEITFSYLSLYLFYTALDLFLYLRVFTSLIDPKL